MKRLLISCGGTGGHFYPGLSIARQAQAVGINVTIALSGKHIEKQQKFCNKFDIDVILIDSIAIPSKKYKLFIFPFQLFFVIWKALKVLKKTKFNIVLTMGSFTSVPLGIATKLLGKNLYLHEGNVIAGKANRFLSRFAQKVFISFPLKFPNSIKCEHTLVGMPLRPELIRDSEGASYDNCQKGVVILVFGGSQGASLINKKFKDFILKSKSTFEVIHLIGNGDVVGVKKFYEENNIRADVFDYYEDMASLYKKANLVICRSGASSLAELALFAKATIFIPLGIATDNHQKMNASYVESQEGCRVVDESNLDSLPVIIDELLENKSLLKKLSTNINELKIDDSAMKIINELR